MIRKKIVHYGISTEPTRHHLRVVALSFSVEIPDACRDKRPGTVLCVFFRTYAVKAATGHQRLFGLCRNRTVELFWREGMKNGAERLICLSAVSPLPHGSNRHFLKRPLRARALQLFQIMMVDANRQPWTKC